jgi:hypothetical protein
MPSLRGHPRRWLQPRRALRDETMILYQLLIIQKARCGTKPVWRACLGSEESEPEEVEGREESERYSWETHRNVIASYDHILRRSLKHMHATYQNTYVSTTFTRMKDTNSSKFVCTQHPNLRRALTSSNHPCAFQKSIQLRTFWPSSGRNASNAGDTDCAMDVSNRGRPSDSRPDDVAMR